MDDADSDADRITYRKDLGHGLAQSHRLCLLLSFLGFPWNGSDTQLEKRKEKLWTVTVFCLSLSWHA